MGTANISPAEAHRSSSIATSSPRWLKVAFVMQSILLILLIFTMGFVSWKYSERQRAWADENLKKQQQLEESERNLKQALRSLMTSEYNFAFYLMGKQKYDDALLQIDNVLREEPADAMAWRLKALILIRANRAQEGLDDFHNAKLSASEGRNLITEAIFNCALNQPGKAEALKVEALAKYTPQWNDKEDFRSVCHRDLQ